MGFGQIIASFAVNSIPGLFITYGLVTGAGYSMIYLVSSYIDSFQGSSDSRALCSLRSISSGEEGLHMGSFNRLEV